MDDDLAERLLPLEGGVNFRDMGGYETEDGRRVKWRHLYRSGSMSWLTPADYEHLSTRGIRTVIDLRTGTEQLHDPNHWARQVGITYWSRDHEETFGDLHEMIERGIESVEQAHDIMANGFRQLPFQQAEAFAELFRQLAASEVPLAFHCAAGKDRTGGAAALVLAALGVGRDAIVRDFILTERAVDLVKALRGRSRDPNVTRYKNLDTTKLAPLSAAHPGYVTAFLDSVGEKFGSVENYLSDLGITRGDLGSIRNELLE